MNNNITINNVELASELAHLEIHRYFNPFEIYVEMDNGDARYTDEMQETFNDLYDMYLEIIESTQVK
jgi:hypothetical protein